MTKAEELEAKAKAEAAAAEAEAEAARQAAAAAEETVLQRRKIGRGSTRRIVRAKDTLDAALEAFRKEMDTEVYQVDAEGKRIGPWPALEQLAEFKTWILAQTSEILQ
jgi:hypothetical protein